MYLPLKEGLWITEQRSSSLCSWLSWDASDVVSGSKVPLNKECSSQSPCPAFIFLMNVKVLSHAVCLYSLNDLCLKIFQNVKLFLPLLHLFYIFFPKHFPLLGLDSVKDLLLLWLPSRLKNHQALNLCGQKWLILTDLDQDIMVCDLSSVITNLKT